MELYLKTLNYLVVSTQYAMFDGNVYYSPT